MNHPQLLKLQHKFVCLSKQIFLYLILQMFLIQNISKPIKTVDIEAAQWL